MKIVFIVSLSCLLMTSCMYSYYIQPEYRLSQLPTIPTKEVEVIFPSEDIPDKNYFKLGVLEASGGESSSYNDLVQSLKAKAQQQGADAVLIVDKSQDIKLVSDATVLNAVANVVTRNKNNDEPTYSTKIKRNLAGVGIKYAKNINYLDRYAKSITVSEYNSLTDSYTERETVNLKINGQPSSPLSDSSLYNTYYYKLSLDHLLNEISENWTYSNTTLANEEIVVRKRDYYVNKIKEKTCKFNYFNNGKPSSVSIHYATDWLKKETISFVYNKEGVLISKTTDCKGYTPIEERYNYEGRKLISRDIYKIEKGDRKPFLKAVYTYYQSNDWQYFQKK